MSGLDGANDSICNPGITGSRQVPDIGKLVPMLHKNTVHFKVPNTFLRAAMAFLFFYCPCKVPNLCHILKEIRNSLSRALEMNWCPMHGGRCFP